MNYSELVTVIFNNILISIVQGIVWMAIFLVLWCIAFYILRYFRYKALMHVSSNIIDNCNNENKQYGLCNNYGNKMEYITYLDLRAVLNKIKKIHVIKIGRNQYINPLENISISPIFICINNIIYIPKTLTDYIIIISDLFDKDNYIIRHKMKELDSNDDIHRDLLESFNNMQKSDYFKDTLTDMVRMDFTVPSLIDNAPFITRDPNTKIIYCHQIQVYPTVKLIILSLYKALDEMNLINEYGDINISYDSDAFNSVIYEALSNIYKYVNHDTINNINSQFYMYMDSSFEDISIILRYIYGWSKIHNTIKDSLINWQYSLFSNNIWKSIPNSIDVIRALNNRGKESCYIEINGKRNEKDF